MIGIRAHQDVGPLSAEAVPPGSHDADEVMVSIDYLRGRSSDDASVGQTLSVARSALDRMLRASPQVDSVRLDPMVIRSHDGDVHREIRCDAVVDHGGRTTIVSIVDDPARRFFATALQGLGAARMKVASIVVTGSVLAAAKGDFTTLIALADHCDDPVPRADVDTARLLLVEGAGEGIVFGDLVSVLGGSNATGRALALVAQRYLEIQGRLDHAHHGILVPGRAMLGERPAGSVGGRRREWPSPRRHRKHHTTTGWAGRSDGAAADRMIGVAQGRA